MSPPTVPIIICQIEEYHSAAEVFASIATDTADSHIALLGVLNTNTGMAGSDSIGQSWATSYDEAAGLALQASERLIAACVATAELITGGAYNHERTEAAADFRTVPDPPPPALRAIPCVVPQALPAAGSGLPEPFGWSIIKDAVGAVWPNGHQDQLRAAQGAWHTAAANLRTLALRVTDAVNLLNNQQSQEIPAAVTACGDRRNELTALADAYQTLGDVCGEYASHLDEAHHTILEELKDLAVETVAWEIAFALLIPVTAGLSEVVGNSALVARAAFKARRIAQVIGELATKVGAITTTTVRPLIERIKPLLEKIKQWVDQARVKIVSIAQTKKTYPSGESLTDAEYVAKYGSAGAWKYPGADYAIPGTVKMVDLPAGTKIDRYGHEGGSWLSPEATPLTARSLPPDTLASKTYSTYEVAGGPLPPGWKIEESVVAPWFGETGYGIQYKIINEFGNEGSVAELLRSGYLIRK